MNTPAPRGKPRAASSRSGNVAGTVALSQTGATMSQNPEIVSLPTRIGAAAASDESRYAMSSVRVTRAAFQAYGHAVATNGRILALARVDVSEGTVLDLPAKACNVKGTARGPAPTVQVVNTTARVGSKAWDMPEQGRTFPPYVDIIPNGTPASGARFVRVAFNPELLADLCAALSERSNGGAPVVEMVFQVDEGGTATAKPALVVGRAERGAAAGVAMLCVLDGKAQTADAREQKKSPDIARRVAHGEAHPWEERKQASASTTNPCAAAVALAEARAAT
jgi:hypothetical protein